MNIQAGTLLKIIPLERRGKILGPHALAIVQRQFCGPMTARGFCPANCMVCKDVLLNAFSLDGSKNEEAVLTWRLKTEFVRQQEHSGDHKAVVKKDAYGLPTPEANPFDQLRKQYHAEPTQER
jgi:hypothetical protein